MIVGVNPDDLPSDGLCELSSGGGERLAAAAEGDKDASAEHLKRPGRGGNVDTGRAGQRSKRGLEKRVAVRWRQVAGFLVDQETDLGVSGRGNHFDGRLKPRLAHGLAVGGVVGPAVPRSRE